MRETRRLFHSLGPTMEKAQSPLNFSLDLGTINNLCSDDFRNLTDEYGFKRSERWLGADPVRALKSKILKSIL